jgi:TonB family protein
MARQRMLKPDPLRYPHLVPEGINAPDWSQSDTTEQFTKWEGKPAPWGQEELPPDLALDLRLHEILEEACLATAATGGVIALDRGGEMVCRATSGDKAPALGVCLNIDSGLSGTCVQRREMQRCDDALDDPRVNAHACRDLDIRSILVLPVIVGGKLRGIFEIFSSTPYVFSEANVRGLQALCGKISDTVHEAAGGATLAPVPDLFSAELEAPSVQPEGMAQEIIQASEQHNTETRRRDYWTATLTASVIVLAVLLGWMLGRAGWSVAVNHSRAQLPAAPEEAQAAVPVTPDVVSPGPAAEPSSNAAEPPRATSAPTTSLKRLAKPKGAAETGNDGLVVYEQGKLVFRSLPSDKTAATESSDTSHAASQEDNPASSSAAADAISPPALVQRVAPVYPEDAKQQHIQGPVVLHALVGREGSVRELKLISGDPHLVKAAEDAVRQWRFKPHFFKGRPVDFETRITVNFALP